MGAERMKLSATRVMDKPVQFKVQHLSFRAGTALNTSTAFTKCQNL